MLPTYCSQSSRILNSGNSSVISSAAVLLSFYLELFVICERFVINVICERFVINVICERFVINDCDAVIVLGLY